MNLNRISDHRLAAVRQAVGAENGHDSKFDGRIARMTAMEFVKAYSQWELGTPSWGVEFYNLVIEARDAEGSR